MSDFAEEHNVAKKIGALTTQWAIENELANNHLKARHEIEEQLKNLAKIDPSISGSRTLPNRVRVSCKLNRKWNQEFIYNHLDLKDRINEDDWPFSLKFVESKRKMDALQFIDPTLHETLQEGLTESPAKPVFKQQKEKQQ